MTRTGWATPEEREYLLSCMPEYEVCQVKRRYKDFWQRVNSEFLSKFPVINKLFPGLKITDLTVEQRELHTNSVQKQQQRIKEWFRWQLNPRSRTSGGVISKKDLHAIYHGRSRVHKPCEVFAKIYADEVEAEKVKRCQAEGIQGRQMLNVWHDVVKTMYEAATEEQIQEVKKRIKEEEEEAKKDEDESPTPENYLRFLKKLPLVLGAAITPAVRKAGVLAFVTIVGPNPEQDGKITCQSLQFGDKPDTPVFSQTWDNHDTVYVEELARFARRHEFSPEVCVSRSLRTVKLPDTKETETDKSLEEKDSPPQVPAEGAAQVPKTTQSPESARHVGTPPDMAGSNEPPALPPNASSSTNQVSTSQSNLSLAPLEDSGFPSIRSSSERDTLGPTGVDGDDKEDADGEEAIFADLESWDMENVDWDSIDLTMKTFDKQPGQDLSTSLQSFGDLLPPAPLPPSTLSTANPRTSPNFDLRPKDGLMPQHHSNPTDLFAPAAAPQSSAAALQTSVASSAPNHGSATLRLSTPPGEFHHSQFANEVPFPVQPAYNGFPQSLVKPVYFSSSTSNSYTAEQSGFSTAMGSFPSVEQYPGSAASVGFYSSFTSHSVPEPPLSHSVPSESWMATSRLGADISGDATFAAVGTQGLFPTSAARHEQFSTFSSAVPSSSTDNSFQDKRQTYNDMFAPSSGGALQFPQVTPQLNLAPLMSTPSERSGWEPASPSLFDGHRNQEPSPMNNDQKHLNVVNGPSATSEKPPPSLPHSSFAEANHRNCSSSVVPTSGVLPVSKAPPPDQHTSSQSSEPSPQEQVQQTGQRRNFQGSLPSLGSLQPSSPAARQALPPPNDEIPPEPRRNSIDVVPSSDAPTGLPHLDPPITTTTLSIPEPPSGSAPPQVPPDGTNSTEAASCRRSSRGSVPSKRHDQLQLIGSNAVTKAVDTGNATPAAWFTLAIDHLRTYELGENWSSLIEKWGVLESSMGYGKLCKGSLNTRGRPDEWGKWTSKSWQGVRRYDKVPQIEDPADLGIAITRWWSSLQPTFRCSLTETFPLAVYAPEHAPEGSDPWTCLRKSGPNGLIALIMLLAWWGKAAMSDTSRWGEDSLPAWNRLVQDVIPVLDAMYSKVGRENLQAGAKRPLADVGNNTPAPRKRARK